MTSTLENVSDIGMAPGLSLGPPVSAGVRSKRGAVQDKLPPKSLLFVDPPYFRKGHELYKNFYKAADHQKLAEKALSMTRPWIVTYDDAEEIRRIYNARRQYGFTIHYSLNEKREGIELPVASKGLRMPSELRGKQVHKPTYRVPKPVRLAPNLLPALP